MSYFFLRFIPYLYYFIRGQYHRDIHAPVGKGRRQFKYRTVIAILLSTLISVLIFGGYMFRQQYKQIQLLNRNVSAAEHQGRDGVSQERYEHDLSRMSYKNGQLLFDADTLESELSSTCARAPGVCRPEAKEIITSHKELRKSMSN